ncbi:MAG TPA: spermidine synthase, partial [Nitrospiria bacterium]|nr:spermidine synthase [Nitrospiria bacterium]
MSTNGKEVGRIIRAIFVCFFLSGSAGLIYQVLWVRMLGLIFGHTVHAITTVLVIFMAGLALGSYFFGRRVDRMGGLLRLYGALEIGIGLYCLFIPLMLRGVEWSYLHISNTFHISQSGYTLLQFFLVFPVLVIPTLLMGGTLPILSRYFVS